MRQLLLHLAIRGRGCSLHRRNNRLRHSAPVPGGVRRPASAWGGARWLLALGGLLCLGGCWAPPNTVLRKEVPPGPLATLRADTAVSYARVEALDCAARTVTLRAMGAGGTYAIGPRVRDWQRLRPGDAVSGRIKVELSAYIPAPVGDVHPPSARVQLVDQSFRLITLQYASGDTDIFKVDLNDPLRAVMPGAWIDIRPLAVTSLEALGERRPAAGVDACAPAARSAP